MRIYASKKCGFYYMLGKDDVLLTHPMAIQDGMIKTDDFYEVDFDVVCENHAKFEDGTSIKRELNKITKLLKHKKSIW